MRRRRAPSRPGEAPAAEIHRSSSARPGPGRRRPRRIWPGSVRTRSCHPIRCSGRRRRGRPIGANFDQAPSQVRGPGRGAPLIVDDLDRGARPFHRHHGLDEVPARRAVDPRGAHDVGGLRQQRADGLLPGQLRPAVDRPGAVGRRRRRDARRLRRTRSRSTRGSSRPPRRASAPARPRRARAFAWYAASRRSRLRRRRCRPRVDDDIRDEMRPRPCRPPPHRRPASVGIGPHASRRPSGARSQRRRSFRVVRARR